MKESTEELKAIIDNAPGGAQFYDQRESEYVKFNGRIPMFHNARGWHMFKCPCRLRSLSDIEEIIKLREFIAGLQLSVPDEVKANELLGVDDGY